MEGEWTAKRIELWRLLGEGVKRSDQQLAEMVGMSRSWVQKWRPRVREVSGDSLTPFLSQSRRRKTSPRQVQPALEAKILHLREQLTERYRRRVGARNILYHLHHDEDLKRLGLFVPKAQDTVHKVLERFGRIPRRAPRVHVPMEPAAPMQVWEMDFSDVSTAQSSETEKRQHQVELFDVIDTGSSMLLATYVSDRCDAAWALRTLFEIFQTWGLPRLLRLDRDPRFITSWTATEFPSALVRCLLCLGVKPDICPPRRPDRKPYVERVIRTQKQEAIYPQRPATVAAAQRVLDAYRAFYNAERPNQALTCGNQPPSAALGQPPQLPRLPERVNPDAWLAHYHGKAFRRKVPASGSIHIGLQRYYIGKRLRGQRVLARLDAQTQHFEVWLDNRHLKTCPLRGLFHGELPLTEYIDYIVEAARSEAKRLHARRPRRVS